MKPSSRQKTEYLQDSGLLTTPKAGIRVVSTATMLSVRSVEGHSMDLSEASGGSGHSSVARFDANTIEIPDILHSVEML